jgi:hypothetical protein
MAQAGVAQTFPRLRLYSEENYRGFRRTIRGNVGIANLEARYDDVESLRFFSTNPNATLVLFSRTRFRGSFRVFRGNTNLRDLDDIIRGNDVESLISSNIRLSLAQIRAIRDSGNLPPGFRRL